jgi:hypothetical protein
MGKIFIIIRVGGLRYMRKFDWKDSDFNNLCLIIGSREEDFLSIEVFARAHPQCSDYWDGNWLKCRIRISAGDFRGEYSANLRADEFNAFRNELDEIHQHLSRKASYHSMEDWIELGLRAAKSGECIIRCLAKDEGTGKRPANKLNFTLSFSQNDIPGIIERIDAILEAFPVFDRER